jgi:hypothetical protein
MVIVSGMLLFLIQKASFNIWSHSTPKIKTRPYRAREDAQTHLQHEHKIQYHEKHLKWGGLKESDFMPDAVVQGTIV